MAGAEVGVLAVAVVVVVLLELLRLLMVAASYAPPGAKVSSAQGHRLNTTQLSALILSRSS
jgi:hypothetical protein